MVEQTPEFRLSILEREHADTKQTLEKISDSLEVLVRLELHHSETRNGLDRAFKAIKEIEETQTEQETRLSLIERAMPNNFDERFRAMETAMPGLKETRKWVITGVLGIVSVVGMAILGLAIVREKSLPPNVAPVQQSATEQKPIPREMRR